MGGSIPEGQSISLVCVGNAQHRETKEGGACNVFEPRPMPKAI